MLRFEAEIDFEEAGGGVANTKETQFYEAREWVLRGLMKELKCSKVMKLGDSPDGESLRASIYLMNPDILHELKMQLENLRLTLTGTVQQDQFDKVMHYIKGEYQKDE